MRTAERLIKRAARQRVLHSTTSMEEKAVSKTNEIYDWILIS